jgi:AraC-like DNA-binding protein
LSNCNFPQKTYEGLQYTLDDMQINAVNEMTIKNATVKVTDKNGALLFVVKGSVEVCHTSLCGKIPPLGKAETIKIWLDENHHHGNYALLEKALGISMRKADSIFRKKYNKSICKYRQAVRMERAFAELKTGETCIKEMAHKCGYNSLSHFCRAFKKRFGITPKECKNGIKTGKKGKIKGK